MSGRHRLWHIMRILLAYLAAVLVAAVAVALCLVAVDVASGNSQRGLFPEILIVVAFGAAFIAFTAALPALALIGIAEWWRLRSPWLPITASAVLGIVVGTFLLEGQGWTVAGGVAGLGGGFVYWQIAGRHAGALRDVAKSQA